MERRLFKPGYSIQIRRKTVHCDPFAKTDANIHIDQVKVDVDGLMKAMYGMVIHPLKKENNNG